MWQDNCHLSKQRGWLLGKWKRSGVTYKDWLGKQDVVEMFLEYHLQWDCCSVAETEEACWCAITNSSPESHKVSLIPMTDSTLLQIRTLVQSKRIIIKQVLTFLLRRMIPYLKHQLFPSTLSLSQSYSFNLTRQVLLTSWKCFTY